MVDSKCHSLTASYIRERRKHDPAVPVCDFYEVITTHRYKDQCTCTGFPHSLLLPMMFGSSYIKDEVEFWSCDCIMKETVWNRPEKVDHLAYKNLQGSGIIKMIRNLAKSW